MREFTLLVLCALSFSALAEQCGNSVADKNCQDEYIKDTKIVVNGNYSDPGGLAQKEAKQMCCLEKAKDAKAFEKKYGDKK
jgi:hypothetical protein